MFPYWEHGIPPMGICRLLPVKGVAVENFLQIANHGSVFQQPHTVLVELHEDVNIADGSLLATG